MKCVTNSPLNFLKVKTELGAILLNHTWVGPLSVVGKTLHMISSGAPWRCMRVLNDSRWSKGSFDPLYASICGILNLVGRGKDMTSVVNGELIQWTSLSKLMDIQPFKAFIIKSIFSFIVCISCTMCKMLISSLEERLVSYWSCLLTMLLSSWFSLSWWSFVRGRLLLRLSLSCVSLWSFNSCLFRYSNCCSNLWFRWVSHSIATARVCTFLFNALGGLSLGWWWQLIVWGLYNSLSLKRQYGSSLIPTNDANWWCTKIVSELIVHTRDNGCTWRIKEKNQSKGTGGIPAKDPPKVKSVMEEFPRTQECKS